MTDGPTLVLVAARLAVLALGTTVTWIGFRAYRQERTRYLRDATLGFAVITLGVLAEGVLFEVVGLDLPTVHAVESVAIAVGFVALLSSLRR